MRSLPAAAAGAVAVALALVPAARAHPLFQPTFVSRGAAAELLLGAPNERRVAMTAIELTAPPTVELLDADSPAGWLGQVDGNSASWSGGSLAAGESGWFPLRLRATGEPGHASFTVTQRFADGRTVTWPAELGVTPGTASDGGGYGTAIAAAVAVGVVAASAVLILRLRRRPVRHRA
jgi:hypothetical protein